VADRLQAGFTWPAFFESDGNAAALAQLLCDAAADLQGLLAINIGTFVGGGLVLGSRVHQGRHGNAGRWHRCPSVQRSDYLVHHASLYALDPDAVAEQRTAWTRRGDEALAFAVTSAISLLNLEAVIIDGAFSSAWLDEIAAGLRSHSSADASPDFFASEIRKDTLGNLTAAVGAGLLPPRELHPRPASLFKKG
jgi:predicted NBD/HSP70 family sugar kinase